MKMFELLPKPLGTIFRKLTHLTCNSPNQNWHDPIRNAIAYLNEHYAEKVPMHWGVE